ncbi:MAG: exodeoxyribonuclease VII small subunit [Anaerolineae bacterium]|nr:exodeoxyribonuclease VII small subunit [Anaerolineae bacterium]
MVEKNNLSFEQALTQLEQIVQQLKGNAESLADAVTLFQQGRKLADYCQSLLDKAELQIAKLNQAEDGSQSLEAMIIEPSET